MPEKATCELVLLVDANGDYAVGKDFDAAKDNYESDVQELSACEGGFRVMHDRRRSAPRSRGVGRRRPRSKRQGRRIGRIRAVAAA